MSVDLSKYSTLPSPPFLLSFAGRPNFANLLNERGLNGAGVEIGTHQGVFAEQLLNRWKHTKFYCVDPWDDNLDGYQDRLAHAQPTREQDYTIAYRRLARFGVGMLRMTSNEAAKVVNVPLDFVYIDGNHQESYFRQDVELWWPKLRSGGILAGHDIEFSGRNNKQTEYHWRAGIEKVLVEKFGLIYLVYEPGTPWSWYVIKD